MDTIAMFTAGSHRAGGEFQLPNAPLSGPVAALASCSIESTSLKLRMRNTMSGRRESGSHKWRYVKTRAEAHK